MTFPIPAHDGSHNERAIITVALEGIDGTIPTIEVGKAALERLEGWADPQVEDAENGIWNVEVPAQTEATLRHEGWLETWAIAPNGERILISAET